MVAEAATPRVGYGFTAPVIVWLAVQLATIVLTTSRIPLWANYPKTSEQLTLEALLQIQIVSAALLFPFLMGSLRSTMATAASSFPFSLLAGAISSTPVSQLLWASGFAAAWLLALGMWVPLLRSERAKRNAVGLMASIALGGPVLTYLLTDYAPTPALQAVPALAFAPTLIAHKILLEPAPRWLDLSFPTVLIACAALAAVLPRFKKRGNM